MPIGVRSTTTQGTQIVELVADDIYNFERFDNTNVPFAAVLRGVNGDKEVDNVKHQFYAEARLPRSGTITGGLDTTQTTVTVDAVFGAVMKDNMLVYIPSTGERIFLGIVNNATYVATGCIRNFGAGQGGTQGTATSIVAASAQFQYAGEAYPEGGTAPTSRGTTPERSFNYIQTFADSWDFTDRALVMNLYGEKNTKSRRITNTIEDHKAQINAALIFGIRNIWTHQNKIISTMGGAFQHFKGNNHPVTGGILTMNVFYELAEKVFENDPGGTCQIFHGPTFGSAVNRMPQGYVTIPTTATSFGTNMKEIVTPHGKFQLVCDPKTFFGEAEYKLPVMNIKKSGMQYVHLKGENTTVHGETQDKKDWVESGFIKSIVGIEFKGDGLDHSLAGTAGPNRSLNGVLYTTAGLWTGTGS